jgi:translation elongation factor EF-4
MYVCMYVCVCMCVCVCVRRLMDGGGAGDKVAAAATALKYEVLELGIMHPEQVPSVALYAHALTNTQTCAHAHCKGSGSRVVCSCFFHITPPCLPGPSLAYRMSVVGSFTGQVGYVVLGMRSAKEARVGDTIYHPKQAITPLPGFQPAKAMVRPSYLQRLPHTCTLPYIRT